MGDAKGAARVVNARADRLATYTAPVMTDIRVARHVSRRAIATELNSREILTRCGGWWVAAKVRSFG